MQVKIYILLCFLVCFLAEAAVNLCPEWETPVKTEKGVRLEKWRFSEWGDRQNPRKNIIRKARTAVLNGKAAVILENSGTQRSANILFRTIPLKQEFGRNFRLTLTAVNAFPQKALVKVNFHVPGKKSFSTAFFTAVSEKPEEKSFTVQFPAGSKSVTVSAGLFGPGKVTLSDLRFEPEPSASRPYASVIVPEEIFQIPERMPVEFPLRFSEGLTLSGKDTLQLTLPWGIRFIGSSSQSVVSRVSVQVGEKSIITISPAAGVTLRGPVFLLLGTDLPVSENILSGSVEVLRAGESADKKFFRLRIVKEVQAVPPRFFQIGLSLPESVQPHESAALLDNGMLRSGANFFVAGHLRFPARTLRNARISHYVPLSLPQARPVHHCYYAQLRDESFWEKCFLPALRRNVLRYGNRNINGIICESYLGQKRAVTCLCSLCRAELADFAPKLLRRNVMNYSSGLLNMRFPKELQAFRKSRLNVLREGAKHHLPSENGFNSKAALIYSHHFLVPPTAGALPGSATDLIDFQYGFALTGDKKYNSAANFLGKKYSLDLFRRAIPRSRLIASFSVRAGSISPEQLRFELFNFFAAGANGVWLKLPAGISYRYRSAIAQTVILFREYENYFRRQAFSSKNWHLETVFPDLEIPPVPGAGSYPLPLPEKFPALKLMIWKSGQNTLVGVGNFASVPVSGCLKNSTAEKKWNGTVNGKQITGTDLREKGIDMTFPAHSWNFFEFRNL